MHVDNGLQVTVFFERNAMVSATSNVWPCIRWEESLCSGLPSLSKIRNAIISSGEQNLCVLEGQTSRCNLKLNQSELNRQSLGNFSMLQFARISITFCNPQKLISMQWNAVSDSAYHPFSNWKGKFLSNSCSDFPLVSFVWPYISAI